MLAKHTIDSVSFPEILDLMVEYTAMRQIYRSCRTLDNGHLSLLDRFVQVAHKLCLNGIWGTIGKCRKVRWRR